MVTDTGIRARPEPENEIEEDLAGRIDGTDRTGPFAWFQKLAPTRLTSRIILINIAGLIILVLGFLFSNQFREGLIDARVQSLMTQARIISAAVASSASVDTGQIVIDPDRFLELQQGEDDTVVADPDGRFEFLIKPEQAGPVLSRIARSNNTRARIYDRDGVLLVDSRYFYGRGEILRIDLLPQEEPQGSLFDRGWQWFNKWAFDNDYPLQKEYGLDNGKDFAEVTASLNGASVSVVRANDKNEIIVSVAVPVQRFRRVLGSLVLSTQGGEIDTVLHNERRIVFFTFLIAALVAILLSLSLAGHIAEPIRRLAAAAERVRRGVDSRVEIPDFSSRRDEVGHLSGALRDMTKALYDRIDAIEAFAADVSHELKNPLTSLRSAVETFQYAKSKEQRDRLVEIVTDDVKRLDRLITDISDASRLDAELARSHAAAVNMRELLETLVGIANEVRSADQASIRLEVADAPSGMSPARAFIVMGHDNRLGQVVRNLLDNAASFAPSDSEIRVSLRRDKAHVELRIDDEGPGINPANKEKIFKRFYTDRPEGSFGKNSGLGLSITKQIIDAHNGTIEVKNRTAAADKVKSGASFIVRLPAPPARRKNAKSS